MDLQALMLVLWRKKWILIIVPFFAMATAFLVRFLGEWKFVSTAQLATGLTISDELIDKEGNFNPYEVQVTFNNLTEMIRSRLVIGQVSYRLMKHDLADSAHAFRKPDANAIKKKFDRNPAYYTKEFITVLTHKLDSISLLNAANPQEKQLQGLIEAYGYDNESILKNLVTYRLNQSDFIELTYTSENATLSAYTANTTCTEFIRYYSKMKASSSSTSLESLESIATQRKQNLEEKMKELSMFKSQHEIYNSDAESEAKVRQLENYEKQISDEQAKIRGLEVTLANLNVRISDAEVGLGLHPNDRIITLRRKINDVNERYIRGGQSDARLLDTLTNLRSQLDVTMQKINDTPKVSAADLAVLKNKQEESRIDLEIARQNLTSLNSIYNAMRYSAGNVANNEQLGKALEKEVEVATEENQSAQNRLMEAKEKLVTNKMSITQILVAEPADKAESRKTVIFMAFGGIISFVICAFVIVVIELSDSRIRTAKRFKEKTRMKLAGTLPKMASSDLNWSAVFQTGNGKQLAQANEELRKIRFELLSQSPRVLLVTSVKKGQGKSFFIVALAHSLSLLRKRVLIIDTNLRNNSLTQLLLANPNLKRLMENFAKGAKLIGSADGQGEENGAPSLDYNLITKTQNEMIDVIGNRKSQLSPSEIIPGGDFKILLEWLKVQYDYILLEGPSLNSYSDTKELVRYVDLVIPVFSADAVIDNHDNEALNYLKSLQAKLGPAILNNDQEVR